MRVWGGVLESGQNRSAPDLQIGARRFLSIAHAVGCMERGEKQESTWGTRGVFQSFYPCRFCEHTGVDWRTTLSHVDPRQHHLPAQILVQAASVPGVRYKDTEATKHKTALLAHS